MPVLEEHSHDLKSSTTFSHPSPLLFLFFIYFIIPALRLIPNIYCPPTNSGNPSKVAWCLLWENLHTDVEPFSPLSSLCLPPCRSCWLTGSEFLQPTCRKDSRLSLVRLSLTPSLTFFVLLIDRSLGGGGEGGGEWGSSQSAASSTEFPSLTCQIRMSLRTGCVFWDCSLHISHL